MSFATKLGQFAEGFSEGIGPGLNLGASIAQGNRAQQTLDNQTSRLGTQEDRLLRDQIITQYETDPAGAINKALQAGNTQLADELRARGPAEQTKLANAALIPGAAALSQGQNVDLTNLEDIGGGIDALNTGISGLEGVNTGIQNQLGGTRGAPTGQPGVFEDTASLQNNPVANEAAFRAEQQQIMMESQKALLDPAAKAMSDLQSSTFIGPAAEAKGFVSYEEALLGLGVPQDKIASYTEPVQRELQGIRDNEFLRSMTQYKDSKSLLRASLGARLGIGAETQVESYAASLDILSTNEASAVERAANARAYQNFNLALGIRDIEKAESLMGISRDELILSGLTEDQADATVTAMRAKLNEKRFADKQNLRDRVVQMLSRDKTEYISKSASMSAELGSQRIKSMADILGVSGFESDDPNRYTTESLQRLIRVMWSDETGDTGPSAAATDNITRSMTLINSGEAGRRKAAEIAFRSDDQDVIAGIRARGWELNVEGTDFIQVDLAGSTQPLLTPPIPLAPPSPLGGAAAANPDSSVGGGAVPGGLPFLPPITPKVPSNG
tara:strand:+ start:1362 stop:3035 length:1674 start_codon:yes stop_codon:yes gene_type:complete